MISADQHSLQTLIKQNEVIIALLAKSDNGTKRVRDLVTRGKRDPSAYARLYNALDGTIGVSECGKLAGVTPGTVSPILKTWELQGIVYDTGTKGKPMYKHILLIPDKEATNG